MQNGETDLRVRRKRRSAFTRGGNTRACEWESGRLGDGRVGSDILDFRFLIPEWKIFAAKGRKENKRNLTGKKRGKAGKNGK